MQAINELFRTVRLVPLNEGGWFPPGNQQHLERLIREHRVRDAIEVGSWIGLSSRFIAERIGGMLYCVDLWEDLPFCRKRLANQGITRLFQQFLSNCVHAGLAHRITPIRLASLEAAETFSFTADLIYIDAEHTEAALHADICAWARHLNPGGVICGDDWGGEGFPGVEPGVRRAAAELGFEPQHDGRFWWLVRK